MTYKLLSLVLFLLLLATICFWIGSYQAKTCPICAECTPCEEKVVVQQEPTQVEPPTPTPMGVLENFKIVDVYDGDTFYIDLDCTDDVFCKRLPIRVNGIDTPELKTKNKCEHEAGLKAKEITNTFLKTTDIKLKNCTRGKYFRLVCDVEANGVTLSKELLNAKLAYEYDGGTKAKINWCEE